MTSPPLLGVLLKGAAHKWTWLIAALAVSAGSAFFLSSKVAGVRIPEVAPVAQSSVVLAADGEVVATLHGEENRRIVPLNEISQHLLQAVLSAEDRDFFSHNGTSIKAIIRAAGANLLGGGIEQGGSTITQQYVRNALPEIGKEKRLARKLKEAFWAIQLERFYEKSEIIDRYLNTIYFGRGAYGAEAAARTYFKVSAKELSLGQAAYLAGMIHSPLRNQIDEDPEGAVALRNTVLEGMADSGRITERELAAARKENLREQFRPGTSVEVDSPRAGYFVEYVRRLLKSEFNLTDADILRGGLEVHTTLDLRMQDAAEEAISSTLNLETDPEAALVAMGPKGEVKAMVGGRDVRSIARARGFNFAADVNGTGGGRQAGSAFKPFALAAFVAQGKSLDSKFPGTSPLEITSARCRNEDGTPWKVANFEDASFESLTVAGATLSSVNTVYAQMMDKVVSPRQFMATAQEAGIDIPASDRGCALALGTSDVTPLEMARAYTTFAQRGMRPEPLVITRIVKPDGTVVGEKVPVVQPAMERNVADTVNYVLARNVQGGTGIKAKFGKPAAGKTGTTQNHANAWFAGYTPDLTAVVWMGYAPGPDGKIPEMTNVRGEEVTGGGLPAVVWRKFMSAALKNAPLTTFKKPSLTGEVLDYTAGTTAVLAQAAPSPAPADGIDVADPPSAEVVGEEAGSPDREEDDPAPRLQSALQQAQQQLDRRQDRKPDPDPPRSSTPSSPSPVATMEACFPFCED